MKNSLSFALLIFGFVYLFLDYTPVHKAVCKEGRRRRPRVRATSSPVVKQPSAVPSPGDIQNTVFSSNKLVSSGSSAYIQRMFQKPFSPDIASQMPMYNSGHEAGVARFAQ